MQLGVYGVCLPIKVTAKDIVQAASSRALNGTSQVGEHLTFGDSGGIDSCAKRNETQKACKRFMSTRSGLLFRVGTTMAEEVVSMNDVLRLLRRPSRGRSRQSNDGRRGDRSDGRKSGYDERKASNR